MFIDEVHIIPAHIDITCVSNMISTVSDEKKN